MESNNALKLEKMLSVLTVEASILPCTKAAQNTFKQNRKIRLTL